MSAFLSTVRVVIPIFSSTAKVFRIFTFIYIWYAEKWTDQLKAYKYQTSTVRGGETASEHFLNHAIGTLTPF